MIQGNPIDQAHLHKLKQNREGLSLVDAVELAGLEFIQKRLKFQHRKNSLPQINEENISCSRSYDTPKSVGSLRSDGYESLRESIQDSAPHNRLSKEYNFNMVASAMEKEVNEEEKEKKAVVTDKILCLNLAAVEQDEIQLFADNHQMDELEMSMKEYTKKLEQQFSYGQRD